MRKWRLLTLCLFFLAVLALGGKMEVQGSDRSSSYQNDFVLDSGRLEQGQRSNNSQSTDEASDLFDQERSDKIEDHEKQQAEQEKKNQEGLFTNDAVSDRDENDKELFDDSKSNTEKIVYSQQTEAEEGGQNFSVLFYVLLGLVLIGGFAYVVYIFLRGEG